jgi:hypothetical protein
MRRVLSLLSIGMIIGAGSVSAQETRFASMSMGSDRGDVTEQQALLPKGRASGEAARGAFARNIGPASTVTGYGDDGLGSPNSGNTRVAGVSSAGRADN